MVIPISGRREQHTAYSVPRNNFLRCQRTFLAKLPRAPGVGQVTVCENEIVAAPRVQHGALKQGVIVRHQHIRPGQLEQVAMDLPRLVGVVADVAARRLDGLKRWRER